MALVSIFQRLWDEFNGTELDLLMWAPVSGLNGSATVANGVATLSLAAPANSETLLESAIFHDIEYSRFFAEIVTAPSMSGNKFFRMQLYIDADHLIEFFMSGNTNLTMRVRDAGVNSDTSITYNASTHRWWRIRESDDNFFFDTSTNGISWTNRRTVAHNMSGLSNVKARFYTGHTTGTITADSAVIDNVNVRPATTIFRDDMQVAGDVTFGNWAWGSVDITPVANVPTSANVSGLSLQGNGTVVVQVTPYTAVPGTTVLGATANSISSSGMTVWLLRTNTTLTTVFWMMWRNLE
jgi:hypothetical protein